MVFKAAKEIPSSSSAAFGIASGGFSTTLCRLEIRTAILLSTIYTSLLVYTRDLIDRSLTFEYIYILASELLRVTSLSRAETSSILFSLFDN